jgi:hypothetical protein
MIWLVRLTKVTRRAPADAVDGSGPVMEEGGVAGEGAWTDGGTVFVGGTAFACDGRAAGEWLGIASATVGIAAGDARWAAVVDAGPLGATVGGTAAQATVSTAPATVARASVTRFAARLARVRSPSIIAASLWLSWRCGCRGAPAWETPGTRAG